MEQPIDGSAAYRRTRVLYVVEATLCALIDILVAGAYIAKVAASIGISDGTIGIILSLSNLGAVFYLFALLLANKRPIRVWAIVFHTVNQLCFACVWLIPVVPLSFAAKTVLFITFLFCGFALNAVIESPKTAWYMSMVDDRKRGVFTAAKAAVSIACSMAFGFSAGRLIDHYEAVGDLRRAFIVCGVALFSLTVLHTLTLLLSQERPPEPVAGPSGSGLSLKRLFSNRAFLRVLALVSFCRIATSVAAPFYSTYKIGELGFSMTFVALMDIMYALVYVGGAFLLGKYADRTSFAHLWRLSCFFGIACHAIYAFIVPANARMLYFGYEFCWAMYGAGNHSCLINLVYDSVEHEDRTGAYAISVAVGGLLGFGVTVLFSRLVTHIQQSGNVLFGIHAYAQQFLSVAAAAMYAILLLWSAFALRTKKQEKTEQPL